LSDAKVERVMSRSENGIVGETEEDDVLSILQSDDDDEDVKEKEEKETDALDAFCLMFKGTQLVGGKAMILFEQSRWHAAMCIAVLLTPLERCGHGAGVSSANLVLDSLLPPMS